MVSEPMSEKPAYPHSRTEEVQEVLTGVTFPDPYRWLEGNTDEVKTWQRAQAALASAYVRDWPHYERVRALVAKYSTERFTTLPQFAAGRWFRTQLVKGGRHAQAIVSDRPLGSGRTVFDPTTLNATHPPYLCWIAPSPDGRILAVGVCSNGSENNSICLIEVDTGKALSNPPSQTLMDNWTGGVQWLADSKGFFFSAIHGKAVDFAQQVFFHSLGAEGTSAPVKVKWTAETDYRMVVVSADGRYAVATERVTNTIPVAIAEIGRGPLRWRPFITTLEGSVVGHVVSDRYIAVTNVGAKRGRVVAISLDAENPNNPADWQELLPESDSTLRTITPVAGVLYLTEFVETYSRVRILSDDGHVLGTVPLPGRGAVGEYPFQLINLAQKTHPSQYLFSFSSFISSAGIFSHSLERAELQELKAPEVQLADAVVEDCWAQSADGTRVPYHLVRPTQLASPRPHPTLIYAYGAFNLPLLPQFPGSMAAFVAAGGVFVHAHLRGGAEFGLDWWEGGRLKNKQNCYDDLYAVADHLVAQDRATPERLAVTGHSAGGLSAAVAAMQRPRLWKAVVPRVPVLDLIGNCRDPYNWMATVLDRANISEEDEVRRLATFSPYHMVRDGLSYPAVYLDAGETDPRSPAWHARKFAARMQAVMPDGPPVLVHVWENVGHGWATDKVTATTQATDWLAFIMLQLGMTD